MAADPSRRVEIYIDLRKCIDRKLHRPYLANSVHASLRRQSVKFLDEGQNKEY